MARDGVLQVLERPRAKSGSVCAAEGSALDEFVGACWYACVLRHCPSEEWMLLSNGSGQELVGELSEFSISTLGDEFSRFSRNLESGWIERVRGDFSLTGGKLLSLYKANYSKHEVGNSDDIRKVESEERKESQLFVRMDASAQSRICDEAIACHLEAKLDCSFGGRYTDLDLHHGYDAFLKCWREVFDSGFRICVELEHAVGYDLGEEVKTLYLEYSPAAGYHLYPAILEPHEMKESIFLG